MPHRPKIISLWAVHIEGSPRIVDTLHDDLPQSIKPASGDHIVERRSVNVRAIMQIGIEL